MGPLQPGVDAAFCATRAFGRTLALVHPAAWSYGSHRTQCPPVTVVIVEERIEQHLVGRRPDHGELAWRQGRTPSDLRPDGHTAEQAAASGRKDRYDHRRKSEGRVLRASRCASTCRLATATALAR